MSKATNRAWAQKVQSNILYLKRKILPLVGVGSQWVNYECAEYFQKALDLAIRFNCNGFLVYTPLKTEYSERPKMGIFNSKDLGPDREGSVFVEIINMDENGPPPNSCS